MVFDTQAAVALAATFIIRTFQCLVQSLSLLVTVERLTREQLVRETLEATLCFHHLRLLVVVSEIRVIAGPVDRAVVYGTRLHEVLLFRGSREELGLPAATKINIKEEEVVAREP